MSAEGKKTSPWVYVGIGCAVAVLLAIGAVVSIGVFGYRKAKQFEAEMKDPQARTAKVQRVLGCDRLPEGYHAVVGMSIPFVLDMAILSDKPPEAGGATRGIGSRGFIYMKILSVGKDRDELRNYFEGKTNDAEVLRRNNIRIDTREILKRGSLQLEEERLLYLAQRGDLSMGGDRARGVTSLILVECSGDQKQRMGIWFGPDPSPDRPASRTDFAGTPADENAIRDFMSHFRLCRAS